jgi:hypothetical protein
MRYFCQTPLASSFFPSVYNSGTHCATRRTHAVLIELSCVSRTNNIIKYYSSFDVSCVENTLRFRRILWVSFLALYQFLVSTTVLWRRGSSVSIMSGYGLDDQTIQVRSPAEARDFSSDLCVQSGVHTATCTMDTESPFPGGKTRRGVTLTTHPVVGLLYICCWFVQTERLGRRFRVQAIFANILTVYFSSMLLNVSMGVR